MCRLRSSKAFLFIAINLLCAQAAMAEVRCASVLIPRGSSVAVTEEALNASIESLAMMRFELETEMFLRNGDPHLSFKKATYEQKEKELFTYLIDNGLLTREEIREKMRAAIAKNQITKRDEDLKEADARQNFVAVWSNDSQKAQFNYIKPGKFGETNGSLRDTKMTKPYHMMSTLVTQSMWARVLELTGVSDIKLLAPSANREGTGSSLVVLSGELILIKSEHPVENVGKAVVLDFIDALNELSRSGDPLVQKKLQGIFVGHEKGDVYNLPTEAQWLLVATARGAMNEYNGFHKRDVDQFAWHFEDSKGETQAVGLKRPRMVDGFPFYDLEGNVAEMILDQHRSQKIKKDPVGFIDKHEYDARGGSVKHHITRITGYTVQTDFSGNPHVGIRLVRTRESELVQAAAEEANKPSLLQKLWPFK